MIHSRRTFGKFALAAYPLARGIAAVNSTFSGVKLGVGSYSFRGFGLDDVVSQVAAIPWGEVELESWFVEPGVSAAGRGGMNPEQREALRKWRLTAPLDELSAIRKKFVDKGIHIYAYNIPINDSFTDAEIDRVFKMTQALGADILNVVTTLSVAPRLVAPSAQYKMRVGFHPSGNVQNPDAIGTGDSWRKVIALAPNFGVNPDLGQCANWGPDPLAFVREMHERLTTLHTHDRRTDAPPGYAPFGQGQMPIKEILTMIKKEKYSFVPMVERIYPLTPGMDNVTELRNSLEYCKSVLAAA
jgi:sugar phosphate isomerase/epimerase